MLHSRERENAVNQPLSASLGVVALALLLLPNSFVAVFMPPVLVFLMAVLKIHLSVSLSPFTLGLCPLYLEWPPHFPLHPRTSLPSGSYI